MFCHFRISIAGTKPRRVVFELYPDKCPMTCDNFVALCRSSAIARRRRREEEPRPSQSSVVPTYRGTEFHRILRGFMIQGGDYENFDGSGGRAATSTNDGSPTFPDEDFSLSHDREGVLSMANRGRDTNGSQFFVTLGRASHLDDKHVAFGRVILGMEVLRDASCVDVEAGGGRDGRPVAMQRVIITDCGHGTGSDHDDDKPSLSSLARSNADVDRRAKCRSGSRDERRRRQRRRRRRLDDDDDFDDETINSSDRRGKRSRNEDDGSRDHSEDQRRRKKRHAKRDDHRRKKHGKETKASRRRRDACSPSSSSSSSSSSSGGQRHHHIRSSKDRDYKSRR